MTQRESRLSSNIRKALTKDGHFVFKVHGSGMMMAGLPDLIVCADGLFIGLEVKHGETRSHTSPRQELVHERIRLAGGIAKVVCSVEEARSTVQDLLDSQGCIHCD